MCGTRQDSIMTDLTKRDYFADFDILRDPYP